MNASNRADNIEKMIIYPHPAIMPGPFAISYSLDCHQKYRMKLRVTDCIYLFRSRTAV